MIQVFDRYGNLKTASTVTTINNPAIFGEWEWYDDGMGNALLLHFENGSWIQKFQVSSDMSVVNPLTIVSTLVFGEWRLADDGMGNAYLQFYENGQWESKWEQSAT